MYYLIKAIPNNQNKHVAYVETGAIAMAKVLDELMLSDQSNKSYTLIIVKDSYHRISNVPGELRKYLEYV